MFMDVELYAMFCSEVYEAWMDAEDGHEDDAVQAVCDEWGVESVDFEEVHSFLLDWDV